MPTQEEIDSSPYHEKLQRPVGSAKSRDSAASSTASTKQYRAKTAPSSRLHHKKPHALKRESKMVSNTLQRQLEDYINITKREQQFSTIGIVTTTHRMEQFDTAYRLIEADQIERNSPRNPKTSKKSSRRRKPMIEPIIEDNSRRVVQYNEIDRLVENATRIYESLPIDKLALIHRYRPHPEEQANVTQTGKVQGYHRHLGSALHAQKYVDFYSKTELDCGKPTCGRLKKLPKKKSESNDESFTSTNSRRTSQQDWLDKRNGNK